MGKATIYMRKAILSIFALILLASVVNAAFPYYVESYCIAFDKYECNEHFKSFFVDNCNSRIKCILILDEDRPEFLECQTLILDDFADCDQYPTELCFNGVAYDTSVSRTCECGGIEFKEIDSCGIPGLWSGTCLNIDSCVDREVHPVIGTTVIMHEECKVVSQDCTDRETLIQEVISKQDKKEFEETDKKEVKEVLPYEDEEIIEEPEDKVVVEVTNENKSTQFEISNKEQREIDYVKTTALVLGIIVLIGIIIYLIKFLLRNI